MQPPIQPPAFCAFGDSLRRWRRCRHLSQLELAGRTGVSSRHISFLETGRSRPSREMVRRLAAALEVPLRQRNALSLLAGFAPQYEERRLDHPDLEPAREGIEFLLRAHEPYPAFVVDRRCDIVLANRSHRRLLRWIFHDRELPEPLNVLRLVMDPALLRPLIRDWEVVATVLLRRLDRQMATPDGDGTLDELRREILDLPGVGSLVTSPVAAEEGGALLLPFVYEVAGQRLSWFTTLAAFGAAVDITLQEVTIEFLYPADDATKAFARDFASRAPFGE